MYNTYFLAIVLSASALGCAKGQGFKIVYDYNNSDDKNMLTTLHDGEYLYCDKECIDKSFANECRFCQVDRDLEVWCLAGKVSRSCREQCCDCVEDIDTGEYYYSYDYEVDEDNEWGRGGSLKEAEHEMVHDYDNWMYEETLTTLQDGEYMVCEKRCIDYSFNYECNTCELDDNLNVFCEHGRIPLSCLNECCDYL